MALSLMINMTGLMYYFIGLERRAKKCLWVRFVWIDGVLQRRSERLNEELVCKEWVTEWTSIEVTALERASTVVKEYDNDDDEFRHLGYTASLIGSSDAAETDLAAVAKKATMVFIRMPRLRGCGANIVASAIVRKVVCALAFAKGLMNTARRIESGYGSMLRRAIGVAQGFPWDVLSGSLEFDGLGALRLETEVTRARLR